MEGWIDIRVPPAPARPLYAVVRPACEIERGEQRWVWPGWIPRGAVTVLAGDPGAGKSILTVELAARVTTRRGWPLGEGTEARRHEGTEMKRENRQAGTPVPPGQERTGTSALPELDRAGVMFLAGEDSVEQVLLPRLEAAGADIGCCEFVDGVSHKEPALTPDELPEPHEIRKLRLPDHIGSLGECLVCPGTVDLVIVDPVASFMAPGASAARGMAALTRLAQVYDLAVLAVCHLSKTRAHRMLYRVRGALDYVSVARSVLLLSVDHTSPGRRVLHQIKSAYGAVRPPVAFRLRGDSTVVEWEAEGEGVRAAEFLDLPAETQTAAGEARDWLKEFLKDGPRAGREVRNAAREAGISQATLYRARGVAGVRAERGEWRVANGE